MLRSSYSVHWRRMLPPLLRALELKCNNTGRPVMDAIDLLGRYLEQRLKKAHSSTRSRQCHWTG
ncbi:hypothetical protein [Streptomyces cinereoruber]|uniref:hypothetical protein n=1 Tax=Streptomyces cinereoruber TaxID=67260 RepID=UPI00363176CF